MKKENTNSVEEFIPTPQSEIVDKEIRNILAEMFEHTGSLIFIREQNSLPHKVKFKISTLDALIKYDKSLNSDDIECIAWKRPYNITLNCSETTDEISKRIKLAKKLINSGYHKDKIQISFDVIVEDNPIFGIKPDKINEEEIERKYEYVEIVYDIEVLNI